ncbi:hypothetical protein Clacol_009963 [Clathrus columnatus]|uniref:DNA polymerase alpha subunit B n=1 Tax=Clathrus columnatus TaxID=1419009 RepID=A0AAV5AUZ8_9AGAM|nr:hypothetical protein Clacol_009963 [Clathrus columnatus]
MNASQIRQTLAAAFEISITENSDIIEACYKICVDYNFKPDDLLFEWQALNFNANQTVRGLERSLTSITLDGAKELRNHVAKLIAQKNEQRKSMRGRGRGRALNFSTGTRVNNNTAVSASQPAAPLATSRKSRLQNASPSVQFNGPSEKETNQRAFLDDRIDEFAQLLRERYGIEEFEDPSSLTDGLMTVIGRICVDAEVDPSSSKLSATTLMLEASRMIGSGKRVPLRFTSDLRINNGTSYKSLFPGEIVAFRGKNGGGGVFLVEEILSGNPCKHMSDHESKVPTIMPQRKSIPRPLMVYVTSGPYTSEQSLDFTPFASIINEAKASHPSTLILLGPFIDSAHPIVKAGKLPASPLQLFQQHFMEPITSLLIHHSDMLIILIPHVRDILCGHAVYPQSASETDFGPLPSSTVGDVTVINPSIFGKSYNMAQIQIPAVADQSSVKEVIHVELKRLS